MARRPRHRAAHRLLHDPPGDHGVLRRGALGRARARAEHGAGTATSSPTRARRSCYAPLVVLAGLSTSAVRINLPFNDDDRDARRWLEPVVEFGERHRGHGADDQLAAGGHRRRRRPRSASSSPTSSTRSTRLKAGRAARSSPTPGTTTRRSPGSWAARPRGFEGVAWFDANVVDGAVNGVGVWCAARRDGSARVQSGYVRNYAAAIGVGVVLLLAWFVICGAT